MMHADQYLGCLLEVILACIAAATSSYTMQANWFPTYTLGEDMALALEVQKAGWKGAYVKVSPHLTGGLFTGAGAVSLLHLQNKVQKAGWKGAYVKVSPHLTGGLFTGAGAVSLLHLQNNVREKGQTGDAGAIGSRRICAETPKVGCTL